MLRLRLEQWTCNQCRYFKEDWIPKRKCKKCSLAYTSEFKKRSEFTKRGKMKLRREASDERLATLYQRIKEKYFDGEYIPESKLVLFTWKKGKGSSGGWCRKSQKEIRIGGGYKQLFTKQPNDDGGNGVQFAISQKVRGWAGSVNTHYVNRRRFVELMIHEALHLRLNHHKKSFKRNVAEYEAKVQDADILALFEGLVKEA